MKLRNTLIIAVLLFLMYSLSKTLLDYRSKIQFYDQNYHEYQAAYDKNKELKSSNIKSQDYYAVERNIREKLNLSKPGEVVVVIPKPSTVPTPTPAPILPPYKQWVRVFF